MKTIEEINEIAPYHPCEWQQGYGIWQAGYMQGQKDATSEQKAFDEDHFRKATQKVIDKACEWITKNIDDYYIEYGFAPLLIEDFRKAMEE